MGISSHKGQAIGSCEDADHNDQLGGFACAKNERTAGKKDLQSTQKSHFWVLARGCVQQLHQATGQALQALLPCKAQSVPMLIQQYRGREDYLLRKVKRKYTTRQKSNRQ